MRPRHSFGLLGAVAHALVVGVVVVPAFFIGCALSFAAHPGEWVGEYWPYALMFGVGLVGMSRDRSGWPGRRR